MIQSLPLRRPWVVLGWSLAALVLLVAAPSLRADDKSPATPGQATADKVEAVLKSQNYFYQRIDTPGQPSMFKVVFQDDKNRTSILFLRVMTWTWKFGDGSPAEALYGFNNVVSSKKTSPAVGLKVAEFADGQTVLSACVDAESGVYVTFGSFSRALDSEVLGVLIPNLHWVGMDLKDQLAPILKAEASEN